MTVDRRAVLRSTASLAALTATGGLVSACDGESAPQGGAPSAAADRTPSAPSPSPDRSPSPSPAALPPLAPGTPEEVASGPRDRPQVALTFHGAGDPGLATALLAAAEQHGARLTVMAVGSWLDQQPQMAARILTGGHELGNHTQNHLDINSLPVDQVRAEIEQCAQRLQRLTGTIGRWFRASGTEHANRTVLEQARAVGYQHQLSFGLDPLDYTDPGAAVVQRRVLSAIGPGSVVTLHMGHQGTVDALPGILDGLAGRGLHAVTASQLFA